MKPITIYWANEDNYDTELEDLTFIYPKPETLFNNLNKNKNKKNTSFNTYFSCPAVSEKFKKILIFNNAAECSYFYDFSNNNNLISSNSNYSYSVQRTRDSSLNIGPTLEFPQRYYFFSDSPVDAYFTPPMFHKPEYTKYGTVIPGEFNIGKWFRPFNFEMQLWSNTGEIIFKENEPLFYVEFKTDRRIEFKQFNVTKQIRKYSNSVINSRDIHGFGKTLAYKYNKFLSYNMQEKILNEIKRNLIDEV